MSLVLLGLDTGFFFTSPCIAGILTDHDVRIYYQNLGFKNCDVNAYLLAASDDCYDVVVLTETWLDSRTLSHQVFGPEFEVFLCDRGPVNSRKLSGGGVLVAVTRRFKTKEVKKDLWDSIEQVWVCTELANRKDYLCGIYVPPDRVRDDTLVGVHSQSVMSVIDMATATDELIVIDPDHSTLHIGAIRFLDCYSSATLRQINHVTNENNRCLALCFVSAQDVAPVVSLAPPPLVKEVRQHPPLYLALKNFSVNLTETVTPVSYNFRKADHRSITEFIAAIEWVGVLDGRAANSAALTLSHIIIHAIDRHVPKIVRSFNSKPRASHVEDQKKAALRTYFRFGTLPFHEHYKKLNTTYKRTSQSCFRRHLQSIQRSLKAKPKTLWRHVNAQRRESSLPSTMTFNGKVASEPEKVCQLFAEKFAQTFCNDVTPADQETQAAQNVPIVVGRQNVTPNVLRKEFVRPSRASQGLNPALIVALALRVIYGKDHYVFQQDSAPAHTAKIVQAWCRDNLTQIYIIRP
ncbi:uncharacterized protein LOC129728890 [Wyeomyia smithii]|uniref:uncharacterized protein LOC129728890 n=1 Tax=Wyeomyia smithii TaxID=174621 RepID=UPI002467C59E|nr:uncharacterized protein LOC129728890 [Wyeomyia smithii]